MLVNPGGSKLWRWRYSFAGKEKLMALGKYPLVTLREVRERHSEARKALANGIDSMIEMLHDGRLDAAIVTLPRRDSDLSEHFVFEEKVLICLRGYDPAAAYAEIPKEVVAKHLKIMFNRAYHPEMARSDTEDIQEGRDRPQAHRNLLRPARLAVPGEDARLFWIDPMP